MMKILFQISFLLRGGTKMSERKIFHVLDSRLFSKTIVLLLCVLHCKPVIVFC